MRIIKGCSVLSILFLLCFANPGFADNGTTKDKAFKRSVENQFPMSAKQIRHLKDRLNDTKRAVHKNKFPKMITRTRKFSFETGQAPAEVRIAAGYVTTMSFFDSTGEPWPLTSVVVGNQKFYNVVQPEGQKHIITVSALKKYVSSNLALTFQDQPVPVTIQLKTVDDGEDTDSLIAFKADARGPKAQAPSIGPGSKPAVTSVMMSFLDYAPPTEAKVIDIQPDISGCYLWSYQDRYYFRTKLPVLWPAWTASTRGPGGVHVYEMPKVPSIVLSQNGESISLKIRGEIYAGGMN